eukprot:TRINITY_DN1835_c0_g1_i4.p1 TRINITY_DN1835_c0_g1~~TRINITY_DN1835_c0_g1_i4.p1  ORF type:complete len:296 (+),score=66.01 TRINITY_DN1835_c0_g1_i4:1-888(+)
MKKEYLPGYTGHIPKKMGTCGITTGEINRRLVTKEKNNDVPEDTKVNIYMTAKEMKLDSDKDELKYGANSKNAPTWIGGTTQGIYPQHIPGYDGHVPGIHSENMFGESFAKITKKAILGEEPKGTDLSVENRYVSYYKGSHNEKQNRRFFEDPTLLKSTKDKEHFEQYVKPASANEPAPAPTGNPYLLNVPTVGYMGHRPVYRPAIVAIGAQEGKHFDLATTKAVYSMEEEAAKGTIPQGFAETLKPETEKNIPIVGYKGFMPGFKARNFHGKTFRECAANSLKLLNTLKGQQHI